MRCGIYVIVSTDDQRDNVYSIDSQLRMIITYCMAHNLIILTYNIVYFLLLRICSKNVSHPYFIS